MTSLHVTYILSSYPGLTTTFVDREITILRRMGIDLHVIALRPPETILSLDQKEIQKRVTYLAPLGKLSLIKAHLRFLVTHPRRYLSTLLYLVTRPHSSFLSRRKTVRQFSQGVHAASLLRRTPVNHIHAHFIHAAIVALVVSRLLRVPYSVTAHASGDIFVKPVMLREKLSGAKFIATCTRYNQEYLNKVGKGVFGDRVKCIYHGLDVQRYQRKQPLALNGRPVILGVGQLKERKGFNDLIDACGMIKELGLDFECRIIGEGPLRPQLEARVRQLDLADRVTLMGALTQEEVIDQYERASLFALPAVLARNGDRDGIPNVILEALAMELPVVSTRHSAVPEVIDDGVNGLLVEPGDSAALAQALLKLLENPEFGRVLGCRGRQTVVEKFDPEKNAHQLLEEIIA